MEVSAVWSLFERATTWPSGAALGLFAAFAVGALLLFAARRRASPLPSLEADSTLDDDEAATGFRSSRFAARICPDCSQPMLPESDGRWRCAGYPACRG